MNRLAPRAASPAVPRGKPRPVPHGWHLTDVREGDVAWDELAYKRILSRAFQRRLPISLHSVLPQQKLRARRSFCLQNYLLFS